MYVLVRRFVAPLLMIVALALSGCATAPVAHHDGASAGSGLSGSRELPAGAAGARYILLGEVHDNAAGHALRLEWLRELARRGPFVLAMEQFDRPMQATLDAARGSIDAVRASHGSDEQWFRDRATGLARESGFSFDGWQWDFYQPVVALALRQGLPLRAANLPARDAMAIARASAGDAAGAVAPGSLPTLAWGPDSQRAIEAAIRDGHCGLLPERAVAPMVRAQMARDATMAAVMVEAARSTGLPVVLLAGNGHVRRDIGVPTHLAALDPGASMVAVGIVERGEPVSGRFDQAFAVAPANRPDPCETLRKHFGDRAR
jgi:uncharacterized iron-regulated protein